MTRCPILHYVLHLFAFQFTLESAELPNSNYTRLQSMCARFCEKGINNVSERADLNEFPMMFETFAKTNYLGYFFQKWPIVSIKLEVVY